MGPDRYVPAMVYGYQICLTRSNAEGNCGVPECDSIHLKNVPETLSRKHWSYTGYVIDRLYKEYGLNSSYYGSPKYPCVCVTMLPWQYSYYRGNGPIYEEELFEYGMSAVVGIMQNPEHRSMDLDQLMEIYREKMIIIPEMEGFNPKLHVGILHNVDQVESLQHKKFREEQERLGKKVCYDTDDEEREDRKKEEEEYFRKKDERKAARKAAKIASGEACVSEESSESDGEGDASEGDASESDEA